MMSIFYTTTVIIVAATMMWFYIDARKEGYELESSNQQGVKLFLAVAVILAPLTLTGFLGFLIYTIAMEARVERINIIINRWDYDAHNALYSGTVNEEHFDYEDWSKSKNQLKNAALREAVRKVPIKDLELMFRTPPNIYKFDDAMYRIIRDEYADRKLLGEN